jgi:two-component system, OmpR family, sensor histidine kinase KdpD
LNVQEEGVVRWVYDHAQAAGLTTETLPGSKGLYLPLATSRGVVGVLGIYPSQPDRFFSPDQRHLLETFTSQTALAIERTRLAQETEEVRVEMESERLRNSLLSSVSHDLRTPLAAIMGAVSSLLQNDTLEPQDRTELATVAYEEADRLNRLVGNLLEMTRLESGGVKVDKEWQPLEEVVGVALTRLKGRLNVYPLRIHLPNNLPLIPLDSILIEQVLVNLLENAVKYTPPGTAIELSARASDKEVTVEVADRGPGLPPGLEQRVFEKFYRLSSTAASGVGLGLTISRGIIEAHGGRIWVENRSGGGASFYFTLPLEGEQPTLEAE